MFDDIVRLAGLRDDSKVIEIGPGTGQATRGLAARGLHVLAVAIDARLAARAASNLEGFPRPSVQIASFEHWDPGEQRFDAVVAFNSWHWVDPAVGMARAAAVLKLHGHLVVVTTPVVVPDGASRFWWEVQDDWVAVGAERLDPATKHPELVEDASAAIRSSDLFEETAMTRHPFNITFSADEYVRNLSTQSGVKQLPNAAQVSSSNESSAVSTTMGAAWSSITSRWSPSRRRCDRDEPTFGSQRIIAAGPIGGGCGRGRLHELVPP